MGLFKMGFLRHRAYLDWLREQPCIITGFAGNENEAVDPAHIGQAGMGAKSSDDEALPVRHSIHQLMHDKGELKIYREQMPDWLLREALRAYAREFYRNWKDDNKIS